MPNNIEDFPVKPSRSRRKTNYKGAANKKTSGLTPKTDKQKEFLDHLKSNNQVFVLGPAGTGKTYMAATMAAKMFTERSIKRIVITRPNVASGKGLGFFPGDLQEKMAPWIAPIVEVLKKHLGREKVEGMIKDGHIVIEPFETMRGRSFDDAFIILDEAQNTTYDELKMFLTRIGQNSKVVVNGDIQQTDLKQNSGLRKIITIIKQQMLPFPVIEMTEDDILRSDVCATWIKAFSKYERQ